MAIAILEYITNFALPINVKYYSNSITCYCTYSRYIVSLGVIAPLCDMLTAQAPKVVTVVLEYLENILKVSKLYQDRYHGVNPFAFAVEEANGNYSHIVTQLELYIHQ